MSAPPARPCAGPAQPPLAAQTRLPGRRAAEPAGHPAGPAAARRADASWRTPAPSPIPPLPPRPPAYPRPPRPRTSAGLTCPPPPHPGRPAPARVPTADPRGGYRAPRALAGGPAAPTPTQVAYSCPSSQLIPGKTCQEEWSQLRAAVQVALVAGAASAMDARAVGGPGPNRELQGGSRGFLTVNPGRGRWSHAVRGIEENLLERAGQVPVPHQGCRCGQRTVLKADP